MFSFTSFRLILNLLIISASSHAAAEVEDKNDPLPPPVLFHVGDKAALQENGRAGTVSEAAWQEFIMGGKTTWNLAPYRRGLYGSDNLDGLEYYANHAVGTKTRPWVMAIKVKEDCRRAEKVSAIYFDDHFGEWVIAHINELLAAVPLCLDAKRGEKYGCSALFMGNIAGTDPEVSPCDKWIKQYLDENKIQVVKDTPWLDSWYLRDRSCIENIRAEPSDVLEALATAKWDLATRHLTRSNAVAGSGFVRLLVTALHDSEHESPALAKIGDLAAASNIDSSTGRPELDATLWVKQAVPEIITAFQDCEKKNTLTVFRSAAKKFDDRCTETADPKEFLKAVEVLKHELQVGCGL